MHSFTLSACKIVIKSYIVRMYAQQQEYNALNNTPCARYLDKSIVVDNVLKTLLTDLILMRSF